MFNTSVTFSIWSISDPCMLFIYVVFVSIRLTYCNFCFFRFSVSSIFIVIYACSSLSTIFLKSKSGSRIAEG